jgi:hypothetical protein
MKVLQSIASVIQALPAEQEIPPVEVIEPLFVFASNPFNTLFCFVLQAIVSPVVEKLVQALQSSAQVSCLYSD